MTDPLYHTDAYLKEFDAVVTAVEGNAVALDRTAFYPGGGGQPHDLGLLSSGLKMWNVTKVRKAGAEVWHEVDADLSGLGDLIGRKVHGRLDWTRRYQLMRTHTDRKSVV